MGLSPEMFSKLWHSGFVVGFFPMHDFKPTVDAHGIDYIHTVGWNELGSTVVGRSDLDTLEQFFGVFQPCAANIDMMFIGSPNLNSRLDELSRRGG